jgi:hypothetical protein
VYDNLIIHMITSALNKQEIAIRMFSAEISVGLHVDGFINYRSTFVLVIDPLLLVSMFLTY